MPSSSSTLRLLTPLLVLSSTWMAGVELHHAHRIDLLHARCPAALLLASVCGSSTVCRLIAIASCCC